MGTFLRLQTYGRVGIWLVEPYEKVGKFVILIWKRPKKDLQMPFIAVKKSTVGFEVYPYLKESKKVFVLFYPLLHPHHLTLINFAEFAERQEMWHSVYIHFEKKACAFIMCPRKCGQRKPPYDSYEIWLFWTGDKHSSSLSVPVNPFLIFWICPCCCSNTAREWPRVNIRGLKIWGWRWRQKCHLKNKLF